MKRPTGWPGVVVVIFAVSCGGGGTSGRLDPSVSIDIPGPDIPVLTDFGSGDEGVSNDRPHPDEGEDTAESGSDLPPDFGKDAGQPPPPCEEGKLCDDGDDCTFADVCKDGACRGQKYQCNDSNGCTYDRCDGYGGCLYPIREDRCLIAGGCYKDGEPKPGDPCMACVAPISNTEWTAADGAACDDGDLCTVGEACLSGACGGGWPNPCDDNNFCTDDSCDPDKGCVHVPNTRPCSDGDPCTQGDTCKGGKCMTGPIVVVCNDHNPCTDDLCDDKVGCLHVPNAKPCDDGDVCTLVDTCLGGVCVGGTPKNCADTNPCTDDSCHPKLGCRHVPNQVPCDDGNPCTDGDTCGYESCQPGPGMPNCSDDDPCTMDSCDPKKDGCVHIPASEGPCDDGNPCTIGDFCEAGVCKPGGVKVQCDDANPCTHDYCDATGSCVHDPTDAACDDGNPCTLEDRCADGNCQPGTAEKSCADDNPCTTDYCDEAKGCVHEPTPNTCSDGNACTVGDSCISGSCVSGQNKPDCDDGNPCTKDFCVPDQGCVHEPDDGLSCDDESTCTFNDKCKDGICQGSASPCEDDNPCTKDICLPNGGCAHELLDTPVCKPEITVTYPPRGAMLLGPPDQVVVTGKVTSAGGAITQFLLNDGKVTLKADGSFSVPMTPRSGTNILRFLANNASGGQSKAVRAFQFTHKYYPVDPAKPDAARIDDGLRIFLGPTVFDDNDTKTTDDFATLMGLVVGNINIAGMIPDPLSKRKVLHCDATIRAKNIKYGKPDIDLKPIQGGLHVRVTIPNISLDINADLSGFLCPSASGSVKASSITVEVDLMVTVPKPGDVKVTLANKKATVNGLDIQLDGVIGFLTNWLINLFKGTIAGEVEKLIVGQIDQFGPILQDALKGLSLNQDIPIPPLIGSGKPVTVKVSTTVSSADFNTNGARLGFSATALATKGIKLDPKGSLARSGCLLAEPPFKFMELNEIELGIFDDLLNQVLYAPYYGGAFNFSIGEKDLPPGTDLAKYGVKDLFVTIEFLLPPNVTDCVPNSALTLQVGDIHIHASLNMMGQPLEMDAYASASARVSIDVVNTATGPELSFSVDGLDVVEIEVESVSSGGAAARYALSSLIETTLLPMVFGAITEGPIASFPIPEIDLSGFSNYFPPGTKITIEGKKMYRVAGHSVLSGVVK